MHWRRAKRVLRIDVCPFLNEERHCISMVTIDGVMQSSAPAGILRVDVVAMLQQYLHDLQVSLAGGVQDRTTSLPTCYANLRTRRNQAIYHLYLTGSHRHRQRREAIA